MPTIGTTESYMEAATPLAWLTCPSTCTSLRKGVMELRLFGVMAGTGCPSSSRGSLSSSACSAVQRSRREYPVSSCARTDAVDFDRLHHYRARVSVPDILVNEQVGVSGRRSSRRLPVLRRSSPSIPNGMSGLTSKRNSSDSSSPSSLRTGNETKPTSYERLSGWTASSATSSFNQTPGMDVQCAPVSTRKNRRPESSRRRATIGRSSRNAT